MIVLGFLSVFKFLAVAIGAGAATVVVAQSLAAAKDNVVSKDEQRLLMVVMMIMRLAWLLLFATHAWFVAQLYFLYGLELQTLPIFMNQQALIWMLLAVLFITIVFIDRMVITRQVGAAVMLATWYALVFIFAWPLSMSVHIQNFVFAYFIFVTLTVLIVKKSHLFTVDTQAIPRKKELT